VTRYWDNRNPGGIKHRGSSWHRKMFNPEWCLTWEPMVPLSPDPRCRFAGLLCTVIWKPKDQIHRGELFRGALAILAGPSHAILNLFSCAQKISRWPFSGLKLDFEAPLHFATTWLDSETVGCILQLLALFFCDSSDLETKLVQLSQLGDLQLGLGWAGLCI